MSHYRGKYRVVQIVETREECTPFEGTYEECEEWIEDNHTQYPESRFYTEGVVNPYQQWNEDDGIFTEE